MPVVLLLVSALICCTKTTTEPDPDILEKLETLSNIDVVEIAAENGYARQFQIDITQALDHDDPAGQSFLQRIYLSHVDDSAPMILATSGYSARPGYLSELAESREVNQLQVAHRFMPGAEPASEAWEYLTIQQSAADLHQIVELFKQIYDGVWISFGGSKNGMAALFHRRFYPEDVEATIALYAEEYIRVFEPVYYQAYTEFGWYRLVNDHLQDLLIGVPAPSYSFFAPQDVPLLFKAEVMQDIIGWLETEGNNIVYIYGGQDPWTAAAISDIAQTNSLKIVQPGANHHLRIEDLDEKELAYSTIEEWTGIDFTPAALGKSPETRSQEFNFR